MIRFILMASLLCAKASNSLASPLSFECNYTESIAANISKAFGVQTETRSETDFVLRFVVERGAKKAQFIGNNGASEVIPIWGDGKVTFVEITYNGTVQTSVVYGLGLGEKASVHSRTSGGEGFEMPSQYYGFCMVK